MLSWVVEYPVSTVLFLVVLFCLFQSWWLKKDFFSPATVYCFSQCITLGIAYFQINRAMTDFKPLTWMIWIGALVAFCGGSLLAHLATRQKGLSVQQGNVAISCRYNWTLHVALSFIPFLLFIVGIYGIIQVAGNLLLLTGNPAKYMTKDTDYGYYAVLFGGAPLCVLLFGVAAFKKFNPVKRLRVISRVMIVLSIVINLLAYPNRGTLFFSLGFIVILYNYLHKRISSLWVVICIALAAGAFVGISSLRDQYGGNAVEKMAAKAVVELPYMYVANNYWNFDYAVNPPSDREYHPHTYGIDFFHGMFEYLRVSESFRHSFRWDGLFNERIEKIHGFNTASYLWEVYKDLYYPGVIIFPFMCGLLLSLLHLRLCRPFTPRQILFYTFFIYFIGWWFFTPGYKQGIYWVWSLVIFTISTVCMWPKMLPADAPVVDKVNGELQGEQNVSGEGEHRDGTGIENKPATDAGCNV